MGLFAGQEIGTNNSNGAEHLEPSRDSGCVEAEDPKFSSALIKAERTPTWVS
jgi:hypothetical protein